MESPEEARKMNALTILCNLSKNAVSVILRVFAVMQSVLNLVFSIHKLCILGYFTESPEPYLHL